MNNTYTCSRDGFDLGVTICGSGDAAIIIGRCEYYQKVFSANLSAKMQLIYMDTRPFVAYDPAHAEADFTLDKFIEDIDAVRKLVKCDRVMLIGHSINAFLALEYARRFPERVSRLMMIASSPLAGTAAYQRADQYFEESVCPERKALYEENMRKFNAGDDHSLVPRMLACGPKLWCKHDFDATDLSKGTSMHPIGWRVLWQEMFAQYDTKQALQDTKCPIFLALGRYDYFNPPHLWEACRGIAEDMTVRVFERSGHAPQYEEPENFDRELLEWLESQKL